MKKIILYGLFAIGSFAIHAQETSRITETMNFGNAVAIDNGVLVVGNSNYDGTHELLGAARVYHWEDGVWQSAALLEEINTYNFPNGNIAEWVGIHYANDVDVSGDKIIIGAEDFDSDGLGNIGPDGMAFIYQRDGDDWNQWAALSEEIAVTNRYGHKVAINEDWAVVSDYYESFPEVVGGADMKKAGCIYVYDVSGVNIAAGEKIVATDAYGPTGFFGAQGDQFGTSIALHEDRIIVGAPYKNSKKGQAYIYEYDGAQWQESILTVAGLSTNDYFGQEVAIYGDIAVVAAPGKDNPDGQHTGAVYTFVKVGADWVLGTALFPQAAFSAETEFTASLAIGEDKLYVGAPSYDGQGPFVSNQGAVFVYDYDNAAMAWVNESISTTSTQIAGSRLGACVAVGADVYVAGAPEEQAIAGGFAEGSVYIYGDGGVAAPQEPALEFSVSNFVMGPGDGMSMGCAALPDPSGMYVSGFTNNDTGVVCTSENVDGIDGTVGVSLSIASLDLYSAFLADTEEPSNSLEQATNLSQLGDFRVYHLGTAEITVNGSASVVFEDVWLHMKNHYSPLNNCGTGDGSEVFGYGRIDIANSDADVVAALDPENIGALSFEFNSFSPVIQEYPNGLYNMNIRISAADHAYSSNAGIAAAEAAFEHDAWESLGIRQHLSALSFSEAGLFEGNTVYGRQYLATRFAGQAEGALPTGASLIDPNQFFYIGNTFETTSRSIIFDQQNLPEAWSRFNTLILHRRSRTDAWAIWYDYTYLNNERIRANNVNNTKGEWALAYGTDDCLIDVRLEVNDQVVIANTASATIVSDVLDVNSLDIEWSNGDEGTDTNNLAPGTYSVFVQGENGCSVFIEFEITESNVIVANIWDGNVWQGQIPDEGTEAQDFVIAAGITPVLEDTIRLHDLYIQQGADLYLEEGAVMCLEGQFHGDTVKINGPGELLLMNGESQDLDGVLSLEGVLRMKNGTQLNSNGNLILKDGASLLQDFTAQVQGVVALEKAGTSDPNTYNFWSSPVVDMHTNNFFEGTVSNNVYRYDGLNQAWDAYEGNMETGIGYAGTGRVNGESLRKFSGTLHQGGVAAFTEQGWNLIGNPFPSRLDAAAFLDFNSFSISNAVYLWDGTNGGYAVYNPLLGGVGAAVGLTPNGLIDVAQGFFVVSPDFPGSVHFTNEMRTHEAPVAFFKKQAPAWDVKIRFTHGDHVSNELLWASHAAIKSAADPYSSSPYLKGEELISAYWSKNNKEWSVLGEPLGDVFITDLHIDTEFDAVVLEASKLNGPKGKRLAVYKDEILVGYLQDALQLAAGDYSLRWESETEHLFTTISKANTIEFYSTVNGQLEIISMSGVVLYQSYTHKNEIHQISNQWSDGIYLIRFLGENGQVALEKVRLRVD